MLRCSTCNAYHMRQFCSFFYCLYDLILLNSIACSVKTTRCAMMQFSLIDFVINWLCLALIGLSRLLHDHIAYETDTAEIIAVFCPISYWLHDLMRLNSIVCHVQTTRYTTFFSLIDSHINWLCWSIYIDKAISTSLYSNCIWSSYIQNHHC